MAKGHPGETQQKGVDRSIYPYGKGKLASQKVLAIQTGFYIRIQRFGKHREFYPSKRHKTSLTVRMKSAGGEE